MDQIASIRRCISDDGKGRGMRLLEVNNGSGFSFTVCPDRGMDIAQAYYKGTPLAWISRNREVAPQFYDSEDFEWLRSWGGGLMTGCGLTNVGGPDTANGERHGLHGRLSHTPAEAVNTSADWSPEGVYTLQVSGRMRQSKVFGENIALSRQITTAYGEPSVTVCDTIENQGFATTPFMLLYHINLGWPLVDPETRLEAPRHTVVPQNDYSAQHLREWNKISDPVPGFAEQVFYHTLPKNHRGLCSIRLVNPKLGFAFVVTYRAAELPRLIHWRMMGQGEYVVGLEPANCVPEGQTQNAAKGLLRYLQAGEKVETFIKLSVEPLKGCVTR